MKFDKRMLRLYAVTDRYWLNGRSLADDVREAILGGATMIQLREKHTTHEEFVSLAYEIKAVCKEYNIPFIINDDIDVMIEVDADGIHVGQEDMQCDLIRKRIGKDKIVGVSAQTVEEAILAEKMGASYLGVGTMFSTSTKLDAIDVSMEELVRICNSVSIPVVAIGGIKLSNIKELKNTMIDGIAVVSAIFAANNIKQASKELLEEADKIIYDGHNYDLYIVDYDGTIIDSMGMWANMFSSYAKFKGVKPEVDLDEIGKTQTNYESALYMQKNYLKACSIDEIINDMNAFIGRKYLDNKLKPGSYQFLQDLKKKGRVVLFSATSKPLLIESTKKLGIYNLFDEIYSASELNLTKADGSGFVEIIKKEGMTIEKTLIVEDAPHAVSGARMKQLNVLTVEDISNINHIEEIRNNSTYYINLGREYDNE